MKLDNVPCPQGYFTHLRSDIVVKISLLKKNLFKVIKTPYMQGNVFSTFLGNQPILSFERVKREKRLFLHMKAQTMH